MRPDCVEYYDGPQLLVRVESSIVPDIGRKISIRGEVWNVQNITYAIDHADSMSYRQMRANVDLLRVDAARAKVEP